MSTRSKIYSSFDDAVRDIPDGATVGFERAQLSALIDTLRLEDRNK